MQDPVDKLKEPEELMDSQSQARSGLFQSHVIYQESWVGAVMPACAFVGSIAAGPLVDRLGRRAVLLHLTWPLVLSWAMIAWAGGVGLVLAGRMLSGVCVGVQTTARVVYMPEIIQLDLRGPLSVIPALSANLGLLVSFSGGQYLSWRGLAWLAAALCLPVLPLLYPLPETPYYLTRTGNREASLSALRQLRHTAQLAVKEQEEISKKCIASEKSSHVSMWEIIQSPNLWPLSVAAALMLAQQTTGYTAVVAFASSILDSEQSGRDSSSSSMLLGIVNFLCTFLSLYYMSKCRRRYLLLVSAAIIVCSLLTLSLFFWAQSTGGYISAIAKNMSFVPVIALLAYIVGSSLGWRIIPWVFVVEGMPSRVRGKASAVVVAINWASAFLITKTFSWSISSLGAHNTFLGYAVMTGISTILIHHSMPETLHQSAAQMDQLYQEAAKSKQQ
ncbi:hypothetical protein OTU49_015901 [Cherax quadricarinatus]|uniref:Major facilitator superfamily (MFS) profile domain-containing protein n=1 Tax=Cherax quadricarinatus TaxID=27406 RepID=A0AAW0Y760_CHEQU|nr:facilitated trehalose transporter Tret1-like isoform X2 [Cherax quadricarinatus]